MVGGGGGGGKKGPDRVEINVSFFLSPSGQKSPFPPPLPPFSSVRRWDGCRPLFFGAGEVSVPTKKEEKGKKKTQTLSLFLFKCNTKREYVSISPLSLPLRLLSGQLGALRDDL